jgi:hypothetical protein
MRKKTGTSGHTRKPSRGPYSHITNKYFRNRVSPPPPRDQHVAMTNNFSYSYENAINRSSARPRPTSSWCPTSAPCGPLWLKSAGLLEDNPFFRTLSFSDYCSRSFGRPWSVPRSVWGGTDLHACAVTLSPDALCWYVIDVVLRRHFDVGGYEANRSNCGRTNSTTARRRVRGRGVSGPDRAGSL